MTKSKKINYCLPGLPYPKLISQGLLLIVFCLLFIVPAHSRTPAIDLSLTWSTDTYVPADYPGKALPTRGSIIEVVATVSWPAEAQKISPQELIYDWFLDEDFQKANSGQGKQVFRFNIGDNIFHQYSIRTEVKDAQGAILSSSHLSLKPVEPEIVLETKIAILESPNLIPKYQVSANQEVKFIAQPYFFNIREINDLNYNWTLDRKEASQISSDSPNIFILEIGQINRSIKQNLVVGAEDKNDPLQRARAQAEITFVP